MALDIGIKAPQECTHPLVEDLVVSLEHVEYSFLLDTFSKFENKTGIKISDCDDAKIEGVQLETFIRLIEESLAVVSRKPNAWNEFVGYSVHPRKEYFEELKKSEFMAKLKDLILVSRRAIESERQLFFFDD